MKTTKETLNELIIQYKSEMLINDPLVQALEDFRDMWEGLEKAVEELGTFIEQHKRMDYGYFTVGEERALGIFEKHLPFLKENQ